MPAFVAMTNSSGYGWSASWIPLAHLGAVRIGGVDEHHAQLEDSAKHADHLVVIARLTPHAWPWDLHGAVPQPHH